MVELDNCTQPCCELCGRRPGAFTRHHLIPKMRHHKEQTRRLFSRDEMRNNVLFLCRSCHKQIHAVIGEKELAAHYTTHTALLAHPEICKFVHRIRTKASRLCAAHLFRKKALALWHQLTIASAAQ